MSQRQHLCDVIVLGYSFEAAVAAAFVAKRGWRVAWVGPTPSSTVLLDKTRIPAAPSILPARAHAPALARVLKELGLDPAEQSRSWQILGERLRLTLPDEAARTEGLKDELAALTPPTPGPTSEPLTLGFFGERAFRARLATLPAPTPSGMLGGATAAVRDLLGDPAVLAEPHDLPGGLTTLGVTLHQTALDRGVRQFAAGLDAPFQSWNAGWSSVSVTLGSGEALAAKAMLCALDEATLEMVLPSVPKRLRSAPATPLLRLSLLVQSRGLPAPLARFALAQERRPIWLERLPLDRGREAISLFWRDSGSDVATQRDEALRALGQLAPFVERYIETTDGPTAVPGHARPAQPRPWRVGRRLLDARGPLLGLSGIEGAAFVGAALAERVMKLAPRRSA